MSTRNFWLKVNCVLVAALYILAAEKEVIKFSKKKKIYIYI